MINHLAYHQPLPGDQPQPFKWLMIKLLHQPPITDQPQPCWFPNPSPAGFPYKFVGFRTYPYKIAW